MLLECWVGVGLVVAMLPRIVLWKGIDGREGKKGRLRESAVLNMVLRSRAEPVHVGGTSFSLTTTPWSAGANRGLRLQLAREN